ncbi:MULTISPECIES: hypothetical protein [unclassified Clostridium]|uniref:hypothetical protein n=1 Tax=unclassified Clostridium TaxID=2614128 RepID=UPI0018988F93|nr:MULTISPECIES: hypothetical protein [unclassified Clostridium]MCR1949474.1 hypothetical protein [Clostridium sp. DSM 100503]
MSSGLKTGLYLVGGVLIIGLVSALAIQLLVWILPFIIVLYIVFKIKGYFDSKRRKKSTNNSYSYETKSNLNNDYSNRVDDSVGEVIDVEYEDLNK